MSHGWMAEFKANRRQLCRREQDIWFGTCCKLRCLCILFYSQEILRKLLSVLVRLYLGPESITISEQYKKEASVECFLHTGLGCNCFTFIKPFNS